MLRQFWATVKDYYEILTQCRAMTVHPGERNERGNFPVWFCDRWPFHPGEHRDRSYPNARWGP